MCIPPLLQSFNTVCGVGGGLASWGEEKQAQDLSQVMDRLN